MAGRLDGRVALVTGSGRGIGRATALRFASEGASVIVNDVMAENARGVADEIRGTGGSAHVHACDLTDPRNIAALFQDAERTLGPLDALINNAGGATPGAMTDCDAEAYQAVIALNLDAVWHCTRAALGQMIPRGRGAIVTISSGAGIGAAMGLAAYGAAKAGVISLMRNVAQEYGPQGIRANTIAPGAIGSPGMLSWLETLPGGPDAWAHHIPSRRLGAPDEIAKAAVFLASDDASYVNGALLPVDGGVSAVLATAPMGVVGSDA